MNSLIEAAQTAEKILVPKSKDCSAAIGAFEEATGIEVPMFMPRSYMAKSQGKTFYSVSAKDVTKLVNQGFADVGVTGKDQYLEANVTYPNNENFPGYEEIGSPMCYLALLACESTADDARNRLYYRRGGSSRPITVVTSFPNLVSMLAITRDMNLMVKDTYQGSIEIMPELIGCDAVVDIVSKSKTAAANGLVVAERLMDIAPVIVGRV